MVEQRNPIATSVIWNWCSQVTRFFISIVLVKIILSRLGNDMYGIWILVGSIIAYYSLFEMGIGNALTRYIAKAFSKNNPSEITGYFTAAIVLFSGIGCIIVVLTVIISFLPCTLFNIPDENAALFQKLILLCGFTIALSFSCNPFKAVLRAMERYDRLNQIGIFGNVLRLFLVIFLLNESLLVLGGISLITEIFIGLYSVVVVWQQLGTIPFNRESLNKQLFTTIFSFSLISFIILIADMIRFKTDSIVISSFIGIGFVTSFHIGNRLLDLVREIASHISSPFVPRFSSQELTDSAEKVTATFLKATRITAFFGSLCIAGAIGSGKQFIQLWVGETMEIVSPAYHVMLLLAFPAFLGICQIISISYMYGTFHHKIIAGMASIEAVANLILSIILVRKFGIYGVALGTAIPMLLTKGIIQPIYISHLIKMPLFSYYYCTLLMPLLICSCSIILQKLGYMFFNDPNVLGLIITGTVATAIVTPLGFRIYFTKTERQWIFKYFNEWINRHKKNR